MPGSRLAALAACAAIAALVAMEATPTSARATRIARGSKSGKAAAAHHAHAKGNKKGQPETGKGKGKKAAKVSAGLDQSAHPCPGCDAMLARHGRGMPQNNAHARIGGRVPGASVRKHTVFAIRARAAG